MSTVSGIATILVTQSGATSNLGSASDIVACYVETTDFDGGDPQALKYLEELIAEVDGEDGIQLTVKYRKSLTDPLSEDGPFSLTPSGDPVFAWTPGSNYFRLRFSEDTASSRWKLNRFLALGRVMGSRY